MFKKESYYIKMQNHQSCKKHPKVSEKVNLNMRLDQKSQCFMSQIC